YTVMELKKISRSKSFEMVNGYGLKSWTKFAIEGDLAEQESPLEAYSELGKIIDEAFKQEYPKSVEPPKEIQVDKPTDKIQGWIQVIELTTNVPALERFKPQVDKEHNQKLYEAYNKQLEKLTNKK
ncbi:MAG: hypothetical protein WAU01_03265, partial [Saprospiraceae bacterium]